MFRRTSTAAPAEPTVPVKPGGKGRPTPSRREAEQAARERARLPRDRKALKRYQRELRVESSRDARQKMKAGDEAYLPPRDQGPVRRYLRDLVDSRLGFSELLAPMLVLIMLMGYGLFGPGAVQLANALWFTTILLVIGDVLLLRRKARRNVAERFPEESLKGVTMYAVMRAVNLRFLRLPKPRVKVGQPLPDDYRW